MHDVRLIAAMFTDIVSSTALLAERDGDAMLRRHFRIVHDAVLAHGGEEVKNLGDGVMAVFPGPSAALASALDIQRQLRALNAARRRQGQRECRLRIGVNAGEAWELDGDWFGLAVVVARRLCDQAEGAQVLTTRATVALVDALEELTVDDLGPVELKGVPGTVAVVEVSVPEKAIGASDLGLATSSALPFVGRRQERATLEAAWRSVLDGQPQLLALRGEPGAGKTRLAVELAALADGEGGRVVAGSCQAGGSFPFQPFAQVLHRLERDRAAMARLRGLPSAPALATLAPGLRSPGWTPPPDGSEADRQLLFDAVAEAIAALASDRPVLLILDDLQWADAPSVLLLQHVLQHCSGVPLLTAITYRHTEMEADHPLHALLQSARRSTSVTELAVGELTEADVRAMLASAVETPPGADLVELGEAIHAEAGGNALFAEALCQHVADHRTELLASPAASDALARGLPSSVRDVVRARVDRLSAPAQALLRIGAVQGSQFDLMVTEATAEVPRIDDALDEALRAGLLRETGHELVVGFPHDAVRHAVYSDLSGLRRQKLHRLVADAMEAGPRPPVAADVALHLAAAGGAVEDARLLEWTLRAARAALEALAFEDAALHAERAVETSQGLGPAAHFDALLLLADALYRAGDVVAGQKRYLEAAQLARERDDSLGLCRAAFGIAGFEAGLVMHGYGLANPAVLELLDEAGSVVGRLRDVEAPLATMMTVLMSAVHMGDTSSHAIRVVEGLARDARRREDWRGLAWMLLVRPGFRFSAAPTPEQLDLIDDLVAGAARDGLADVELWARAIRIDHLLITGDVDAADEERAIHRDLAHARRGVHHQVTAEIIDACRAIQRGDYDEASATVQQAFELGSAVGYGASLPIYGAQLVGLAFERTGALELRPMIEGILQGQDIPEWRVMLAHIHAAEDRPDDARRLIDELSADGFAAFTRSAMFIGPEVAVDVAWMLDDRRHLDALEALLLPGAGQQVVIGTAVLYGGPVDRCLARIAGLRGDLDRADALFAAAADQCARQGARPWYGITCQQHAEVLLRHGGRVTPRVESLLAAASVVATETGNVRLAADVHRTITQLGG